MNECINLPVAGGEPVDIEFSVSSSSMHHF